MDKILNWIKAEYRDIKGNAKWDFFKWGVAAMFAVIAGIWGAIRPSTLSGWVSLAALIVGLIMLAATAIKLIAGRQNKPRDKQPVPIPNIEGVWIKYGPQHGILTLTQEGAKLSGTFREGDYDHAIEDGVFNPDQGRFEFTVVRTHASVKETRHVQRESLTFVNKNLLFFYSIKNALGQTEWGFHVREHHEFPGDK
jgi:hypothetical protein